jgi:GAF domain-containing protein
MLVDYSSPVLNSGKSLDAFFDERLAILQGIAHQTAIAVDNIYLQKAQKEEAYVSVALQQVAQAVVSSSTWMRLWARSCVSPRSWLA